MLAAVELYGGQGPEPSYFFCFVAVRFRMWSRYIADALPFGPILEAVCFSSATALGASGRFAVFVLVWPWALAMFIDAM